MLDIITLAVAEKYTKDTAIGLGAVKGAPCTISKIEEVADGTEITFKWTGDDGSTNTRKIKVMDGISVVSGTIDENKHLILTLSDGAEVDCGELPLVDDAEDVAYTQPKEASVENVKDALDYFFDKQITADEVVYENSEISSIENVKDALDYAISSGAVLDQALTVTNAVGSATSGKTYAKGTSLESIIRNMLIKEVAPSLSLAIVPSTTLYDVVDTLISAIQLKATCTKNTYDLSKVEFYLDNVLKNTQNITSSGTYTYDLNFDTPTNTDFTVKAIVYDKKSGTPMSASKSITVKFVGKSYYGTVSADVGEPSEAIIKALQNNVLKDTKNLTYSGITMDYGKVVYAYPASFGNLSSIKDIPNNIQYFPDSFTKITLNIDSILYNVYYQNEASASEGISLTFS